MVYPWMEPHSSANIRRSTAFLDQRPEFGEQRRGIVRAGGGFRVVLDAEDGLRRVTHAFDGAVVEVQVRDLDIGRE